LNHWSWQGKITPEVIYNFFQYLCGLMQWLMTEGKTLLEREAPLSYKEFDLLFNKAFYLWWQMPQERPVCLICLAVMKKGISSLMHALKHSESHLEPVMVSWFATIRRQIEPGSIFSIDSRSCRVEESRDLIEALVPVAQFLKSDGILDSIARSRYPQEPEAQQWFIKNHKNW
jgi:hypothetical protein